MPDHAPFEFQSHEQQFNDFLIALHSESERGIALIAATMIDDILERTILAFLVDHKDTGRLLDGFNAPLGTFSSRILVALALGLLSETEYSECERIRKIRNIFAHNFPVSFEDQTSPMYGGDPPKKFDHTLYVTGLWSDTAFGQTPQNSVVCHNFTNPPADCALSYLLYLSFMERAQQALGYLLTGGVGHPAPVIPQYPPTDPTSLTQFQQLMTAIGFGIGTGAAHETGHELFLPNMDCSSGSCPEDRIYQNGAGDNEWFYGNLPGATIDWSQSAVCALERYLLGYSVPCN
jgi:hypothetical protein